MNFANFLKYLFFTLGGGGGVWIFLKTSLSGYLRDKNHCFWKICSLPVDEVGLSIQIFVSVDGLRSWKSGTKATKSNKKFTFFSQNLFSIPRDIP